MGAIDNLVDRSLRIEQDKISAFIFSCDKFFDSFLKPYLSVTKMNNTNFSSYRIMDYINNININSPLFKPSDLSTEDRMIYDFVISYMAYKNNPVDLGVKK